MKIQETIQQVAARLDSADLCYGHGTENPLDEAFYLIYGLLNIDFADEQAAQRELNVGEEVMLEAGLEDSSPLSATGRRAVQETRQHTSRGFGWW